MDRPRLLDVDHIESRDMDLFSVAFEFEWDLQGLVANMASSRNEPNGTTCVKIKNCSHSQAEVRFVCC